MTDEMFVAPKSDCYNGVHNLKKAAVEVALTAEQVEEMWKCQNDIKYFIRKYCKIISLDHGLVNFELFSYQERMVDKIENNRFSIFLWPRQMGKSTTVAAVLLHYIVFNSEFKVAILAQKADQAREILGRLQLMYQELPWWMQPGVVTWNKGNIILGNRSEAFTSATKGSGVRGKSISLLYLDEFAHVDNDVEFYESSYPVVTSGTTTKIVITSTPNGLNLFYKLCSEAEQKKNEYVFDRALWSEHPARNAAWKEEQMRNMTERQFDQEFDCVGHETIVTLREDGCVYHLPIGEVWNLLPSNADYSDFKYNDTVSLRAAMENTPGVVYKITRSSDGLAYIGITSDLQKRVAGHKRSHRFKNDDVCVEVLFEGSYRECYDLEGDFIKEHDTWKNGLNTTENGKGNHGNSSKFNTLGFRYSDASRKKMSDSAKRRVARLGPTKPVFTEASRKKMSETRKGIRWRPAALTKEQVEEIKTYFSNRADLTLDEIKPFIKKSQRDTITCVKGELIAPNGKTITEQFIKYIIVGEELGYSRYLVRQVVEGKFKL